MLAASVNRLLDSIEGPSTCVRSRALTSELTGGTAESDHGQLAAAHSVVRPVKVKLDHMPQTSPASPQKVQSPSLAE